MNVFVPRLWGHPSGGGSGYCQRSKAGTLGKETKRYLTKAQTPLEGFWLVMAPSYTDKPSGDNHDSLLSGDHSFFGSEWQKRWCVLNNLIFFYFGSDKGLYQLVAHWETAAFEMKPENVHRASLSRQINSRRAPFISVTMMCSSSPTWEKTPKRTPVLSCSPLDDGPSRSVLPPRAVTD